MKKYKYYFFDLDGTLTQSEFGIFESVRYALNKLGLEDIGEEVLKTFIGPPIYYSFNTTCGFSPEVAEKAVAYYREHYDAAGYKNSPLYPGVLDFLKRLKDSGAKLAVVTGKPEVIAQSLLECREIDAFFDVLVGPSLANRNPDKACLITETLGKLSVEDKSDVVMIGDRVFDIEGAKTVGIDSIGVLYGYGSKEELTEAGATYIVSDVSEIF